MEKETYLEPIKVVYTNSFGHPSTSDAFRRLEAIVPLQGNRFYATYNTKTGEYCACARIEKDEDAEKFNNLPVKTLDGGWYASRKIEGKFLYVVAQIGPTFDGMAKRFQADTSRLPIEFYERHTKVVCYLPIIKQGK